MVWWWAQANWLWCMNFNATECAGKKEQKHTYYHAKVAIVGMSSANFFWYVLPVGRQRLHYDQIYKIYHGCNQLITH